MAVELKTNVVIGGQTTAGFDALAGRLESLGSTVDKIGKHVREFEEESVQTYRSYEDNMLAAEYALSAQYTSATELSRVMQGLDEYASSWAASTIFHTDDVSKAINEAAHAGWDYTEIVKGIPQAMLIAQAGSMDLSQGLDYLVKMMGATGTSFDNMGTLIDQWAKASNLSATNIGEMGQAFMSLGSAAQFGDSTQELFTMLAVLADVGTTGSQAGTMLRAAMMRIIAPTTKAENAMSLLGADAEEINEVLADENVTKAAKHLEGLGFSAYKTDGTLKPMVDIFTDLNTALSGLNEQSQNEILSAIFPTRTIATAKAFVEAAGNGKLAKLLEQIGDSEGYAAEGSEIMMSGLTGAIETLASKWEEFQRQVGETLAPAIEDVAGFLGQIMDGINGMDEGQLSAVVGGLTTIAGLGQGLMIAGGAIKAFTTLGPWGTAFVLAAVGAGALYGYLSKTAELDFKSNFGQMELDLDSLGTHVDSLGTKFTTQQETIAAWEAALEQAESDYATKSSQLSELLLQDVLEGKQLTPKEIEKIGDYAKKIYEATWNGIENAQASDKTFLQALFGDKTTPDEAQAFQTGASVVDNYYQGIYDEAYAIGEEMRNQMTAALQDGSLDEGERQAIQASIDRLNQINAAIASALDQEAFYEQLYKSQSVSWDTISDYMTENSGKMESDLANLEDTYAKKWAHYKAAFEYAKEQGTEFTDLDGRKYKITGDNEDYYWGLFQKNFDRERAEARQSVTQKYADLNFAALDALMNDSDYSAAWKFMRGLNQNEDGSFDFTDAFKGKTREELDTLNSQLGDLWGKGDSIMGRLGDVFGSSPLGEYVAALMGYGAKNASDAASQWSSDLWLYGLNNVPTQATMDVWAKQAELNSLLAEQTRLENEINTRQTRMENRDYAWWDGNGYHKDWEALNGKNGDGGGLLDQKAEIDADIGKAQEKLEELKEAAEEDTEMPLDINDEKAQETIDGIAEGIMDLESLKPVVTIGKDSGEVDGYDPPNYDRYVTYHIRTTGGSVGGGTGGGGLGGVIGRAVSTVGNFLGSFFAEGGRADQPSIFGEAGPEWAIPEEHSSRTAELLDAARKASGFTWGDLISRFGGLNGNASNRNLVLHYSPTINAGNAEGVAQVLEADKSRILKMVRQALEEDRMRNEVEVYA